jgi:hypothetical protein
MGVKEGEGNLWFKLGIWQGLNGDSY